MKKDRQPSVLSGENAAAKILSKPQSRRKFLLKTGGAVAAGAFGAVPLRGWAADPVNIGALYPTTGSMAQIGVGCVAAAKLAVDMVNEAGGIKSLGGAKLNLIVSDVQSDTTVTRTETDRLITGNKLSAIHGCFASALTLIASQVAERAKVPLITGSSSDQLNKNLRLHLHAVRARLAVRAGAVADGKACRRQAEGRRDLREHRVRHLDLERPQGTGARRRRRDRDVRALLGRFYRCEPADQQGQGVRRQRAVLGVLSQRPDPDRAHGQAGRPRHRDQRRLRRLCDSGFLQERRQAGRGPAGRGALEPRHGRQRPEGERRIQEAHRRFPVRICRRPGGADLHAGRRAGARRLAGSRRKCARRFRRSTSPRATPQWRRAAR